MEVNALLLFYGMMYSPYTLNNFWYALECTIDTVELKSTFISHCQVPATSKISVMMIVIKKRIVKHFDFKGCNSTSRWALNILNWADNYRQDG